MIKYLNRFILIVSFILIYMTPLFSSQPEYMEFGNSLNDDRTQSYNFARRVDFLKTNINLFIKDEALKKTVLFTYLLKVQKIIKIYARKNSAKFIEEDFRYFDLLMFNIIYFTQKKEEGKNLKYSRPIMQPRLTMAFLDSLKNKTYKNNSKLRISFLHDLSMSDIFYKTNFFTADDKVRFKQFKKSIQNIQKLRTKKPIPRRSFSDSHQHNNQFSQLNNNTDSLLRLVTNKMKHLYTENNLIGDLFSFNKQNELIKPDTPKLLQTKRNATQKPTHQIKNNIRNLIKKKISMMNIKIWILIIIIILLCIIIIIVAQRNKLPSIFKSVPTSQIRNLQQDIKTPFEDFTHPINTDAKKGTATKFDILNQMLVDSLPKRYENIWKISKGGMGIVFGAHDKLLRRKVAIKMILPILCDDKDIVTRFVNEARSVASIDHSNILKIFDVGGDDYPFFVMEYLEGISLDKLISQKKMLTQKEIQFYAIQLADAFNYCHSKGIIHRDIKPANILIINHLRTAKVVDFGIAKDHNMTSGVTQTNTSIGSPQYMAPEQIQHNKYGVHSDIYAFGMTLFKMATGNLPFNETNFMMKLNENPKHIEEYNPDLNKLLASVIMKCINKDPENRFQNFKQIRTILLKIKL